MEAWPCIHVPSGTASPAGGALSSSVSDVFSGVSEVTEIHVAEVQRPSYTRFGVFFLTWCSVVLCGVGPSCVTAASFPRRDNDLLRITSPPPNHLHRHSPPPNRLTPPPQTSGAASIHSRALRNSAELHSAPILSCILIAPVAIAIRSARERDDDQCNNTSKSGHRLSPLS